MFERNREGKGLGEKGRQPGKVRAGTTQPWAGLETELENALKKRPRATRSSSANKDQ